MSDEVSSPELKLPVHGFVLAGGKSSRMGRDKALLPFRGRPMVQIAVEKLRTFCSEVSIAGNREDLAAFAPVVPEKREGWGPVAGIEAGLECATQPWLLFLPVDVPLLPAEVLARWAFSVTTRENCAASYLLSLGREQPAICMLRRELQPVIGKAVAEGERRVRNLLWLVDAHGTGALWPCKVEMLVEGLLNREMPNLQVENWFLNVNTPDELSDAEVAVGALDQPA